MFDQLLVYPLLNILVAIYHALIFLHIPYALGFSIVILTALLRLVMYPMISSQLRASKKMQELNPHISNLKEKHKGDNTRIHQETMKLYKEHGVNPASGCVSAIVQMGIVIWGLYPAFTKVINLDPTRAMAELNSKIIYTDFLKLTHPWDATFFGIPLGQNPSHLFSTLPLIALFIPLSTGALQFIQSKMMFSKPQENKPTSAKATAGKDDFASMFQSQSMYIFPVMIGFFSYTFPIGLSLYWNTFSIFGILQQYHITGLGGLEDWRKLWQNKTSLSAGKERQ
ncbi:MAG: YidC/Oxa1 family membrane protein insertase [Candidatus Levyibacteriota bacterium]|nr:MAG: YidC/Oxa1 family membrane protein insertase [Candidatus Levybacteria bacterium]